MSSETPSARELLRQLKSMFLSTEFQNLEKTLMDRENEMAKSVEMAKSLEKARAESEMLELRCFRLEAELKENKRVVEEMKEKVTTLNEDLSLSLERAKRAEERCSNVTKELVESEADKVRLMEKIAVLDKEKHRVEGQFVAWKNKSEELDARVARLEDYAIQLSNQDPSLKRKIVQLITGEVTGDHSLGDEKTAANRDDGAGSTTHKSKKDEFSCYGGRVQPRSSNFINIDDSGDEKPPSKRETSIEDLKRKRASCSVKREGYLDDDCEDDNLPIGRVKQRKQALPAEKCESYLDDDDDDDNTPIERVKQKKLQKVVHLPMTPPAVSPASFGQCPVRPCTKETGGKKFSLLSDCFDDSSEDEKDACSDLTKMMMANLRAQGSK